MSKASKLDALCGLGDDDDDDSSDPGSESGSGSDSENAADDAAGAAPAPVPKRKKVELSLEDLERAGYQAGPSVLYIKPPAEPDPASWDWSNGKAAKEGERGNDDDAEDRAATREAVTKGLEHSAELAVKSMQQAAKLREEARKEKERLAEEKRLSFNQKEKRKRDAGQASRGKNYVEESKRQARAYGVYSGFD